MTGKECYKEINSRLNQVLEEKQILIAVHRGTSAGNIIENTMAAYEACLSMGADMFECDLSKTSDGILYAFHDGNEKRILNSSKSIFDMTSDEVDHSMCQNGLGEPSGWYLEKFEEILQHFSHGELFNIDRAWNYLEDVHAVMKNYPDAVRQAVIKTPVQESFLEFFEQCETKYMYMPIVRSMDEVRKVLSYQNINLVGIEAIISSEEDELFQDSAIQWIRKQGLFYWANVITLGNRPSQRLYGGYCYEDDMALIHGPETAWGKLIEKGINVLQTDWPYQMAKFRNEKYGL